MLLPTCRQCKLNVSASISSMPLQPGKGDSCVAMALSECLHNQSTNT